MAPEVVLCRPYNESADIFSLAVIIYEVFSKSVSCPAVMTSSEHYDYAFKVRHVRVVYGGQCWILGAMRSTCPWWCWMARYGAIAVCRAMLGLVFHEAFEFADRHERLFKRHRERA